MHWARQSRPAGVLTGGAGYIATTKGMTALGSRKACAGAISCVGLATSTLSPGWEQSGHPIATPGGAARGGSGLAVRSRGDTTVPPYGLVCVTTMKLAGSN